MKEVTRSLPFAHGAAEMARSSTRLQSRALAARSWTRLRRRAMVARGWTRLLLRALAALHCAMVAALLCESLHSVECSQNVASAETISGGAQGHLAAPTFLGRNSHSV